MRKSVWPLLALLVFLHHDFWFWDDPTLVAGWFPIGLLYHVALSCVAAAFWLFVVRCAWPGDLNDDPVLPGGEPSSAGSVTEAPQP